MFFYIRTTLPRRKDKKNKTKKSRTVPNTPPKSLSSLGCVHAWRLYLRVPDVTLAAANCWSPSVPVIPEPSAVLSRSTRHAALTPPKHSPDGPRRSLAPPCRQIHAETCHLRLLGHPPRACVLEGGPRSIGEVCARKIKKDHRLVRRFGAKVAKITH